MSSSSDDDVHRPLPPEVFRRSDISSDDDIDIPLQDVRRSDVSSDDEDEQNNEARRKFLASTVKTTSRRNDVGTELFPAGCVFPGSTPIIDGEKIGLNDSLTLYYSAFVVCGCSSCKGLYRHQRHVVEYHYYEIDCLPKVEGAMPPTVCKDPIGPVESTRCSDHLHETCYTPHIMSKTPGFMENEVEERSITAGARTGRSIQQPVQTEQPFDLPVEDIDDLQLPDALVPLYKTTYARSAYGAWPSNKAFPKAYEKFSYYDHSFMIKPSEICEEGFGLFIMSPVIVPNDCVVPPLMPFCGPIYNRSDWIRLAAYKDSMSKYRMCANAKSQGQLSNRLYIDGRPRIHGNIAGYINSVKGTNMGPNCQFDEYRNDLETSFMSRIIKSFVCVVPILSLKEGDELLVHYDFRRPISAKKKRLELGGPSNI